MLDEPVLATEDTVIPVEPAGWRLPIFPIVAVLAAVVLLALLSYGVAGRGRPVMLFVWASNRQPVTRNFP